MTTEGDGNYQLQRFLEKEGAECDIQFVTAWILYNIWEVRFDTKKRALLRGADGSKNGLKDAGEYGVFIPQDRPMGGDKALRARVPDLRPRRRLLRLPPARHGRCRRRRCRPTTTTICAAAKATWRSGSSS
jgi:hypothetical protein